MSDLTKFNLAANGFFVTTKLVCINGSDDWVNRVIIVDFVNMASFEHTHNFSAYNNNGCVGFALKIQQAGVVDLTQWVASDYIEVTERNEFISLSTMYQGLIDYEESQRDEYEDQQDSINEEMPLSEFLQTDYCKRNW